MGAHEKVSTRRRIMVQAGAAVAAALGHSNNGLASVSSQGPGDAQPGAVLAPLFRQYRRMNRTPPAGENLPAANRRFFRLFTDSTYAWPNLRWPEKPSAGPPNAPYLRLGLGRGWDQGPLKGTIPRFLVDAAGPSSLSDAAGFAGPSWHIVSARLAELLERLEPGGVATLPIKVEFRGGVVSAPGAYVMLDVTRKLPALDFERMGLEVYEEDGRRRVRTEHMPSAKLLRDDIPAVANLFRDDIVPVQVWASLAVQEAYRRGGFTGLGFAWPDRPAADVP